MRLADLHAAFKMTCELQQHIANVSFRRSSTANFATDSATSTKSDPDGANSTPDSPGPELTATSQNGANPSTLNSSTSEAVADSSESSQALAQVVSSSNATADERSTTQCGDGEKQTLTVASFPRGRARQRHRLVALEAVNSSGPIDWNEYTVHSVPCKPCRLRMGPGTESNATMVCQACPNQPPICSAQCFRWWHARFPGLMPQEDNAQINDEVTAEMLPYPLATFELSEPSLPSVTENTSKSMRGKNRRKNLQLSRIKRAGLRKHYVRRTEVLRSTQKAVALNCSGMVPVG
ncbi:hypothetical protein FBUS_01714 [Fasciolopsis buskii]|uniref:Uncharacterized protein n=1 Tax=Fasciolopsis buskii TaxID=27845 RepID=A0A8E0VNZ4_9TREM|nr:hypothetical protein FBUS_01714 [Fasciolopsis buski]